MDPEDIQIEEEYTGTAPPVAEELEAEAQAETAPSWTDAYFANLSDEQKQELARSHASGQIRQTPTVPTPQAQPEAVDIEDRILDEIVDCQYTDPKRAEKLRIQLMEHRAAQREAPIRAFAVSQQIGDVVLSMCPDMPEAATPYVARIAKELGMQTTNLQPHEARLLADAAETRLRKSGSASQKAVSYPAGSQKSAPAPSAKLLSREDQAAKAKYDHFFGEGAYERALSRNGGR